ncbi:U1 snRNP complex subunit SNP1 PWA37_005365 [Arxiozyma heterogenica]|uniref:U1 snRNP complex subunit SNP1 n=1 Tax=Arxiozyma heterogenica TaxID=278026 RepID=UPI002F07C791
MSKFPPDVTALFKPAPPLKYLKSTDHPVHKRQTYPKIAELSSYLTYLSDYQLKYPNGSRNKYLEYLTRQSERQKKHQERLDEKYKEWDPHNDPHMKNTDPYCTIFVGRLPYDINELELQKIFSKYGSIDRIRIVREKEAKIQNNCGGNDKSRKKKKLSKNEDTNTNNKSRGYGFIVFSNPMSSKKCIRETGVRRGIVIHGRRCIVDYERGRTNKYFVPSRFGGGLGNRGYSLATHTDKQLISNDHRYRGTNKFQSSHPKRSGYYEQIHHTSSATHPRTSLFSQSQNYQNSTLLSQTQTIPSHLMDINDTSEQQVLSYRSRVTRTQKETSNKTQASLDY